MHHFGRGWQYKKVRRTTLIAFGCAAFLSGLGFVLIGIRLSGWVWFALAVILLLICATKKVVAVPLVVIVGLVAGVLRGTDMQAQLDAYRPFIGQKVELTGQVVDDATYGDKRQHDFKLTNVYINGRSPPGQVRITSFAPVGPRRGDMVRATGKLYDGFGNYQAAIYFADISITAGPASPVDSIKRQFAAGVYNIIPEPQASLGLGFLLGLKSQLPDTLDAELKVLALTHIVVASGYNLTILVRLSRRILQRSSKFQATLAGVLLMVGFVAITGFSPSMSRAALVSGLSLAAWYWGRRIHPVILLLFAAAITAGLNPLYLWSDIGWWLSFLAFAGVMIVAPLLQNKLFGKRQPKLIGQIMLETCAAQLMTLPLVLAIFGNLSVLSLIANLLVVPLIPVAMLLTCAAGAVGVFLPVLGAYVALPATWLLTYITSIVHWLAAVPWASLSFKIDAFSMVAAYLGLCVLCVVLWHKTAHDFLASSVVE